MKIDTSLLKLNIGSGHHRTEGWTNLDRSPEDAVQVSFIWDESIGEDE